MGKRLQPRLLSDALTGEWQNGEAGRERAPSPVNPSNSTSGPGRVSVGCECPRDPAVYGPLSLPPGHCGARTTRGSGAGRL